MILQFLKSLIELQRNAPVSEELTETMNKNWERISNEIKSAIPVKDIQTSTPIRQAQATTYDTTTSPPPHSSPKPKY